MIVVTKRRIQIVVSCILIAVFAFYFQIANQEKDTQNNSTDLQPHTIATTATPVSGKTIVIDARTWRSR